MTTSQRQAFSPSVEVLELARACLPQVLRGRGYAMIRESAEHYTYWSHPEERTQEIPPRGRCGTAWIGWLIEEFARKDGVTPEELLATMLGGDADHAEEFLTVVVTPTRIEPVRNLALRWRIALDAWLARDARLNQKEDEC